MIGFLISHIIVREDLQKVSQLHFRSLLDVLNSVSVSQQQSQVDPLQSLGPKATSL